MPPPKAPRVEAEARVDGSVPAQASIVTGSTESLEALLSELGIAERSVVNEVASNNLASIPRQHHSRIAAWYADQCGLHASDVAVFASQAGMVCYVKASGVFRYARNKFQDVEVFAPEFPGSGKFVVVNCKVTLSDGKTVKTFAARALTDAQSIMACATAATVRALRLAVGIPLPSEGELH